MRNDRDRQYNHYSDPYRSRNMRDRDYQNREYETRYQARDYDNDRNRYRDDRDRNYGDYSRDRYYKERSDERGAVSYNRYEEFSDRGGRRDWDRNYDNPRTYSNRGYSDNYSYDRNPDRQSSRGYESDRNFSDPAGNRDYRRYDSGNSYGGDTRNNDRDRNYDRNYGYERDRDFDRYREDARYLAYDRHRNYRHAEPASVKDKYSSSSLHYGGITRLGNENETERDRYEGSRYIARNNSDRNYAGSGMGSSARYRY